MLFINDSNCRWSQWPQNLWCMRLSKVVSQNHSFTKEMALSNSALVESVQKEKHTFVCVLLWKGMLLLTINRWIVAFLGFSFECGITLQIKLPDGAFQSLVPRCQQFSALRPGCASSAPPGGRPDLPESPVQEQKLPTDSLQRKTPQNRPLLWSWEEEGTWGISVSWGSEVGMVWGGKGLVPGPETKGRVSPRPGCWHSFCRLAVSPQTPFIDCSSAFISWFNATGVFMK